MTLEPGAIAVGLVLAIVPTFVYLLILNAIDRYEKEPWTIMLAGIGLGAFVAPLICAAVMAVLGRDPIPRPQYAPGPGGADLTAAVIQEVVKGLLLLGLVHSIRDEFDDVLDGVVYGAAVGAGFAATESFLYVAAGTTLSATTTAALLVSGLNQAFYTAVAGAIMGWGRRLPSPGAAWLVSLYGIATAALLHAFNVALPNMLSRVTNQPDDAIGLLTRLIAFGTNVLGIVVLAIAVGYAWRRESRILRLLLADEVENGTVSAADYASITSIRGRLDRQAAALRAGGLGQVRVVRRLYATEGELAFHKWRLAVRHRRRPSEDRTDELRASIVDLRTRLDQGAASQ